MQRASICFLRRRKGGLDSGRTGGANPFENVMQPGNIWSRVVQENGTSGFLAFRPVGFIYIYSEGDGGNRSEMNRLGPMGKCCA